MRQELWSDKSLGEFYKLSIASKDVHDAKEVGDLINNLVDSAFSPLYQPLIYGFIVCYAKPFLHNKPFGRLDKKWAKFDKPEMEKAHIEIKRLRNKLAAHSDASSHEALFFSPGTLREKIDANISIPINSNVEYGISTKIIELKRFKLFYDTCCDLDDRLGAEVSKKVSEIKSVIKLNREEILRIKF